MEAAGHHLLHQGVGEQTSTDCQRAQNRGGLQRGHGRDGERAEVVDTVSGDRNKDAYESCEKVARRSHWVHRAQICADTLCDMSQSPWRR